MNIIVCIKRVPMTQEVDLEIDGNGKGRQNRVSGLRDQ